MNLNNIKNPAISAKPFSREAAKSVAVYLGSVVLTFLLLVLGLRLDQADFNTPFTYDQDALLILPFVKETVERGTHWSTPRLGAPGTQDLHDFPVIDHLHFGIIYLLGRFFPSPEFVFNLYYLLTYPLTTLTSLYAARRLGISRGASLVVAILYAFQPYHYLRGQAHYFLAAYFIIPLTVLSCIEICQGKLPLFASTKSKAVAFRPFSWFSLRSVVIAALTATAGAYYAFFACGFYLFAGVYSAIAIRSLRAILSAAAVVCLVGTLGLLQHLPTYQYRQANGQNNIPAARLAEEAEMYGLKLAQMFLPVEAHNAIGIGDQIWIDFAKIRHVYQAPVFKPINESDFSPIGFLATFGLLYLWASLALPLPRDRLLAALAGLSLFGLLIGTLGGLGSIFNLLVSPQVRCYNRISIYLAFFALLAVGRLLDQLYRRYAHKIDPLRWPVLLWLILLGMWDQTNQSWFPDIRPGFKLYATQVDLREKVRMSYLQDRDFYQMIEARLVSGMVFNYPHVEFPEAAIYSEPGSPDEICSYEPVRGYLHTKSLRWSYGAMKGREWDAWHKRTMHETKVSPFLERIILAGFDALQIDWSGIEQNRWHVWKCELDELLEAENLLGIHPKRSIEIYDLRPYREKLKQEYSQEEFLSKLENTLGQTLVLWQRGFVPGKASLQTREETFLVGEQASFILVNPTKASQRVRVTAQLNTLFKGPALLELGSDLVTAEGTPWTETIKLPAQNERSLSYDRIVILPPGRSVVRFRCVPLIDLIPQDSRGLVVVMRKFVCSTLTTGNTTSQRK